MTSASTTPSSGNTTSGSSEVTAIGRHSVAQKTAMTAEKALKLADAGFVFDAKKGKRARQGEGGGHHGGVVAGAHGGGGGPNMNAAVGLAVGAHGQFHANPPPLGGHLAPHQWAGHHY